jgi:hypothetical protein
MNLELSGRTALVTGASRGIGFSVAKSLAREGCHVSLVARDANALDIAATRLRTVGGGLVTVHAADLADAKDRARIMDEVAKVEILVNNAGAIPGGTLQDIDEERWRQAWELKVFGTIALCRSAYAAMAARQCGVIVNIIGAAAERPDPAYVAGSAGNAALMALTKALARSGHREGVRVVGINPGFTMTDRARTLLEDRAKRDLGDADRWSEMLGTLPFGRAAEPDEIGDAAAFLASPRSGYTSGAILTIDGGN